MEPDEQSVARARDLLEQRTGLAPPRASDRRAVPGGTGPARVSSRLRLRWAPVLAAAALLIGSALGFGVGSAVTPSGSAGGNFVGFGFLPAHGWNVMQSGTLDGAGVARAIAANVPLEPSDDLEGAPLATVKLLPAHSVVIFVTFSPRGDPTKDNGYPVREPPLRLDDAERLPPSYHVARYRLRSGVGGYNLDARVYFGENAPSTRAVDAAQSQLNRLVVANDRVTIRVQPSISSVGKSATVSGSVDSGRAGEDVKIQGKDCGRDFFRVVGGAVTGEGGTWSTRYWQQTITTTLRAVWRDATSAEVVVRHRVFVGLRRRSAGRFEVRAFGRSVWRKRVFIQRFDRRLGTWRALKSVVLTESEGQSALGAFAVQLPKGTLVRAVFPRSQTGPCYLTGTSHPLST